MKKGFTLIELIIVIAIVGILASILVPSCTKIFNHPAVVESKKAEPIDSEYEKYNGGGFRFSCFIQTLGD
jgi:prepilin-type N-terminal cleavage/methylation domain-containing protein